MPRWYYGWNIIAVATVFQSITYGIGLFSFTFFIGPWMAEFNTGRAETLLAVMAATLGLGAFSPFAGRAMDRLPIRWIVAAGGAVFALGMVLLSQVTAVWQIIVIYAVFIGGGLVLSGSIAGQTLAAKWFRGRRGFAVGLVTVGTSAGGFLMPPLVTYLIATSGWRSACLVLAAIAAIGIIPLTLWIIRNSPEEKGVEPDPDSDASRASASRFADMHWTARSILRDRAFWISILAFLPITFILTGVQQNVGPLALDFEIQAMKASVLMSIWAAMMALGKVFFGAVTDHFDNRYLFWIQASVILPCLVLLMGEPSFLELAIICGVLGASMGGTLPIVGSIIASRFGPRYFGQAMGLMMPFLTVSSFGFVVTGWLRDTTGSYDLALMGLLVILIPAILGMAAMPKLRGD